MLTAILELLCVVCVVFISNFARELGRQQVRGTAVPMGLGEWNNCCYYEGFSVRDIYQVQQGTAVARRG